MRSRTINLAIALLICAISAIAQQGDPYSRINPLETAVNNGTATRAQQLDLARLYIEVGRFYEAQTIADRLLAADPNDADAKSIREQATSGLRDIQMRKVAEAEARAHRSDATDQDQLALADAYYQAGSYAAAADIYAHLPASMQSADVRLRYARSLAWSGQLDPAERAYSALLKEQSTPDLQLEYGRVLSWMGAQKASIETISDIYYQAPTEGAAIALANAKAWSGDREGALRVLTTFLLSHPTDIQASELLDQFRASPDRQIERVSRFIDLQPYNLALRVERVRLLVDAGRDSEALNDIKFVREHSRQNIAGLDELEQQAKSHRASQLSQLEERRKALGSQASMASSSQNPDEILSLAKAYVGIEAYDQAEALYQRYLELRPNDTDARVQYARVLSWDGRWNDSERQYQILLNQYPDRADLRYEYAQVLSYDSQFVPAIHIFRTLTDLSDNPRSRLYSDVPPRAYYNLGQIYRWYGWNDTAALEQNRAIALDPGYMPARRELDLARRYRPATSAEGRYTYFTDSNDFSMKRLDLNAEHWTSTRTAFDLGIGRYEFSHLNTDVFANEINGGGAYRYSDRWLFRGNAGVNFYDSGLGTRPFFGLGAEYRPNIESRAAFNYNHYDLVYDVFTLESLTIPSSPGLLLGHPLSINDFLAHYDWQNGRHWAALGDASYGFISDSNNRFGAHGIVSYQLFNQPFVAIKGDVHYLRYDFRTNRYWSPPDYHSFAGVIQVGQNLRNGWHWDADFKAGKAYESGVHSDIRAWGGNLTIPVSDAFDLIGAFNYGKSGRLQGFTGSATDFINYWQRTWFVGVRAKRLFARGERVPRNPYYFDNRVLTESPVIPPETH
jgi:tetratricopeptide (TPR) repeat protein